MSLQIDITRKLKDFTLRVCFETTDQPLAILGASGSGKSMTLRCIAGIDTPTEGRIVLGGRVLYDSKEKINLPPQQRRVGYLFQNYALFPHMTVLQNIACGIKGSRAQQREAARGMAQRCQLTGLETRYPAQLSGGQQQRVALARILASKPELLLLDEPFSALDAYLREEMQVDMLGLLQAYGGDAIMVTHSRDEAFKLCPRLLVLAGGQAVGIGQTKEMFRQPGRLEVAKLTGCKNISRATVLAPGLVQAHDWGTPLQVAAPMPPGLTHIGVRAHDFYPAASGAVNAIRVQQSGSVESPFEWSVLLRNADAAKSGELWWKYPKGEAAPAPALPEYLAVRPQDVLLLTEK